MKTQLSQRLGRRAGGFGDDEATLDISNDGFWQQ
jgi:hypothetical protein